jgi:25S rRNA (adenine2142-N1)-methyltransferase
LLELGALYHDNYASCSSWIDNHPIDLKSNHPQVLEQDFFDRPLPRDSLDYFDIVSCSLVLNFVSEPTQRGK